MTKLLLFCCLSRPYVTYVALYDLLWSFLYVLLISCLFLLSFMAKHRLITRSKIQINLFLFYWLYFCLVVTFLAKSGARWAQLLPVGARPAFNILGRCRKTIGRKPCWMPRQRSRIGRNRGTPSNGGQNLQAESQTFTLWTRKPHGWTESWKHGKQFIACQFMSCQCMACQFMACRFMACQFIAC